MFEDANSLFIWIVLFPHYRLVTNHIRENIYCFFCHSCADTNKFDMYISIGIYCNFGLEFYLTSFTL